MTPTAVAEGAEVEVVCTVEDERLCVRVRDGSGELFGARSAPGATDRDKRELVWSASHWVALELHGTPRVTGFDDPAWVAKCASLYRVYRAA